MFKNKIESFMNSIFKNEFDLSLERRLFLSSVIIGILTLIIGIIVNIIVHTSFIATVIPFVLLCYLTVVLYFIRVKKIINVFITPTVILAQIGISVVWIFNGGIVGSNTLVAVFTLIVGLIIVPSQNKKYVLLLFLILQSIDFLIQIYRPDLIIKFINEKEHITDTIFTTAYISIMLFLIVNFLHYHYTIERQKVEEGAMRLYELNFKLKETNINKDKFFSIISHDLKSPFSGFLGLTKIMREGLYELSKEELELYIKLMNESANNLYDLLSNLLEWSMMQKGATSYNPEICTLNILVQVVIDFQSEVTKQKNIELVNLIPEDLQLSADKPMLSTVLRNLISNAIKFTPRGGKVIVGIFESTTENICFFVKDSGIGMDSEMLSKMFKINERTSRPGTEKEPSTGLGLLLCKDFIEKHNGKIWIESEVDKGTTFYVSLPSIS
ncbi:MAG: HAMP domain-containing sensor histidine kinase [Candidatus Kapabacteria bacterium]|nr:HAMP domain-containing sensor histidine kinase [Candidatus Kapabacteria bacterium]